jgi:hypothetical protein
VISALTLLAGSAPAQSQRLKLEIGLSQTQYLLYEPVYVDVTLTNLTSDTVKTIVMDPIAGYHSLDIELINEKGDTLNYTGPIATMSPDFFKGELMQPGETWYVCSGLLGIYGVRDKGMVAHTFFPYLPTGIYRIRACHTGVCSQQLEFEVVNPEGEERTVYDEMMAAYGRNDEPALRPGKLAPRLEEFLAKFPRNAYSEKVSYNLAIATGDYLTFLERFPNSGYTQGAISYIVNSVSDKEEFLKKVTADHPGTRSAKFAEQLLKRREKK